MKASDAASKLRTVTVPDQFAPLFLKAQEYVRRYFADRREDPEQSTITISGERYILVRAASMSVEFFDLVSSLYADQGVEVASTVARNLLFDLAHSLGRSDARAFAAKMGVTDAIEKLSAGPIHFSFAGWAFVEIFPESHPSPDDDYYLIYDHPFSFEADAWRRAGRRPDFAVCVMNAGYSSGWCEESFGPKLVSAEVECQARGDPHCRFIMAPPHRIEEYIAQYMEQHRTADRNYRATGNLEITVPEYFQRKRMEEALRAANEQLERRVTERTAELERANKALQAEMIERELAEEERRKVQVKLLHAQKLESLGVLSGGVAHDFNNLLVGILGNAGLVLQDLADDAPVRQTIRDIETAAMRAAELTRQLLAYAGKGQFLTQPVQLSQLVEEMGNLLTSAVSKSARLVYDFPRELPVIDADATQLRQVVMNLITNASEAIGAGSGTIRVRTGVMEATRAYLAEAQLGTGLPEGPYVFLEVEDDGHGMHPATLARIFDPFFTTKFTGRGLGLAAVLGIVRSHRGAIRVTSAPGRGTTIRVLLPIAETAIPAPAVAASAAAPAVTRGGTVLVVDDEETVRRVARRILEQAGFVVRAAGGGVEAMRMLRESPDTVDCVLLDMTMPDMSGAQTLQELKRIRPNVRIVLSSGYTQEEATLATDGASAFIQKPYRPADLVSALRRALAQ
jgi:signal transduction histidine kinase/CheY-like chemotaxis protein/predicted hydrocarbon binding protein